MIDQSRINVIEWTWTVLYDRTVANKRNRVDADGPWDAVAAAHGEEWPRRFKLTAGAVAS